MAPKKARPGVRRPAARTPQRGAATPALADGGLEFRTSDEIMSIVSHDLRAPLLTISTCAHALQRNADNVGELASMIEQAAAWSRRLINDLLDARAIQTGRLQLHRQPTSLHAMLELARSSMASSSFASSSFAAVTAGKDVALAVTPPPADVQLLVDPDRVMQALGNLIANAIRASPSPGTVRIDAVVRPRTVVVRVADDGAGIAPRRLAALLGRRTLHRETARDGNDLGLAIARGIATAHGGRLSAASTIGQGSTFSLSLPRMTSRASG